MILEPPERRWRCPNCATTSVTRRAEVHQDFHHCAGLRGLWAPLVEDSVGACKVVAVEREDYVGREIGVMHDDEGRVVMAVVTVRDDGQDCAVFVPTAVAEAKGT